MRGAVALGGGSSTSGSMSSTVSRDDKWVLSSEEDSSCPDESGLELGLGLSIGGGGGGFSKVPQGYRASPYTRILTAEDFSSVVSSSSSSSITDRVASGTKRSADSVAANGGGQVVGWPPIRAYRMNSLSNQAKSQVIDKSKNIGVEKTIGDGDDNDGNAQEKRRLKSSSFVKVNMDGIAIGRKVDLNAHGCYETLAETLEDMFFRPATISSSQERNMKVRTAGHSKLLDGSSGFALTYEDKDGDWMLVGDVPWGMFLGSVRRLRIMRTCEANGLAPRRQDEKARQRSKPI